MIALDTNILVRLITGDDPVQAREAEALLKSGEDAFFIPDIVLAELTLVLMRRYAFSRRDVGEVLSALLDRRDVVFEEEERVRAAGGGFVEGIDLADGLIMEISRAAGCARLASFDEALKIKDPEFILRP